MPKDDWRKATMRAKYGPIRPKQKARKKPRKGKKRVPPNFRQKLEMFAVYAGTEATVIRPDGSRIAMRTRKNLRFGSTQKTHQEDGCLTFFRFGYYLIVPESKVSKVFCRSP